jgi:hypothetical protein
MIDFIHRPFILTLSSHPLPTNTQSVDGSAALENDRSSIASSGERPQRFTVLSEVSLGVLMVRTCDVRAFHMDTITWDMRHKNSFTLCLLKTPKILY